MESPKITLEEARRRLQERRKEILAFVAMFGVQKKMTRIAIRESQEFKSLLSDDASKRVVAQAIRLEFEPKVAHHLLDQFGLWTSQ